MTGCLCFRDGTINMILSILAAGFTKAWQIVFFSSLISNSQIHDLLIHSFNFRNLYINIMFEKDTESFFPEKLCLIELSHHLRERSKFSTFNDSNPCF